VFKHTPLQVKNIRALYLSRKGKWVTRILNRRKKSIQSMDGKALFSNITFDIVGQGRLPSSAATLWHSQHHVFEILNGKIKPDHGKFGVPLLPSAYLMKR
jgi:hypothetical protein